MSDMSKSRVSRRACLGSLLGAVSAPLYARSLSAAKQEGTFDFKGYKIWYQETGHGQPMLFLHNGGNDHRIWDYQVAHFSKKYRVITIDELGFGQSSCPNIEYTLPLYTEQVAAAIDYFQIAPVILVGHCIGGAMALSYTLQHPTNVKRLILFNVATENTLLNGPLAAVYRKFSADRDARAEFIRSLEAQGQTREQTDQSLRSQMGENPILDAEFSDYIHNLYNKPGQMRALYLVLSRFDTYRSLDELKRPESFPPVCLFWGGANHILPPSGGGELARHLRPDEYAIIPGAGHLVMRERARDVNHRIEAFLRQKFPCCDR